MRILAVDAEADVGSLDLLDLVREVGADRAFLFRAAAASLASQQTARRARADERFLDDVAAFVLEDDRAQDPPERPRDPGELAVITAVTRGPLDAPRLQQTDRAVEMIAGAIGMAVPDRALLLTSGEDLGNATFWIAGGAPEPVVEAVGGVPVLSPGSLDGEGGLLVVRVERRGGEAHLDVSALGADREPRQRERFALGRSSRMSVQG